MRYSNASGDLSSEMEVDAFRRIFPLRFYERHLAELIRPDGRALGKARDTTIALGWLNFLSCLILWANLSFSLFCT